MQQLSLITFKLNQFNYNPKTRILSAEASELPGLSGKTVSIFSPTTGQTVVFTQSKTLRDREGEVSGWEYTTTGPYANIKLIIWND